MPATFSVSAVKVIAEHNIMQEFLYPEMEEEINHSENSKHVRWPSNMSFIYVINLNS